MDILEIWNAGKERKGVAKGFYDKKLAH